MKKIPIILTTLTLATASVGSAGAVSASAGLTGESILGVARLAAEGISDPLRTNYRDNRLSLDSVWPRNGQVVIDSHVEDESKALRRVVIMALDYQKATVAQADADWLNWGGEVWPSWVLKGRDYKLETAGKDINQILTFDLRGRTYNLETNNRPDIIYFYAELGGWDGGEVEIMRGKVDYRSCVETENFKSVTGIERVCNNTLDTTTNRMTYKVLGDTSKVVYESWPEELGAIIQEDVKDLEGKAAKMATVIPPLQDLNAFEDKIEKTEQQLSEATGVEDVPERLEALKVIAKKVRKENFPWTLPSEPVEGEGDGGDDGDDGNDDGDNDGDGNGGDDGDESDNEAGGDEGDEGDQGDMGDTDKDPGDGSDGGGSEGGLESGGGSTEEDGKPSGSGDGAGSGSGGASGGELGKPEVNIPEKPEVNLPAAKPTEGPVEKADKVVAAETVVKEGNSDVASGADGELTGEAEKVESMGAGTTEAEAADDEGIEVPALGGQEVKLWPWLILVGSGLGVAGWWLWRAFGRRAKR